MNEHPIEGLMKTAMVNIKEMVDVNTILGDPVETPDGSVIVPISKVTFGFAAGGSEFDTNQPKPKEKEKNRDQAGPEAEANAFPFGGGSGAGITIHPVAFLVVGKEQTKLLPVESNMLVDRLLDSAPQLLDKIQGMIGGTKKDKQPEIH